MAKFEYRYAVPTLLVSVFLSNVVAHLHWWSGCKLEPVFCSSHEFLDSPISKIGSCFIVNLRAIFKSRLIIFYSILSFHSSYLIFLSYPTYLIISFLVLSKCIILATGLLWFQFIDHFYDWPQPGEINLILMQLSHLITALRHLCNHHFDLVGQSQKIIERYKFYVQGNMMML